MSSNRGSGPADQVSIVGNGTRDRADTLAMNPQGEIAGIEVKLNSGRYTENQAAVYSHIAEGNSAIIVGVKIKPVSEVPGRANPVVTKIESFRVVEPAVGEGRAQIIKNDLPKPK
ncbi:hypothetical protein CCYS_12690 [Corynebacterium cystitidis DSM 20524]|uniref:Uncharacterized protein n=1 Tax=Corynebacterium cystitidis DSM 20524 TaxID=1121357 RepID=A0A1H9WL31_9CORY|nr:hypothetical protein CCYS_12690 [Corynebacterium cystitidis DSM 20524]SES34397.1 hypothetical protein SAMN05661109_02787 [Corynebacterium cystitidis DSM 20524]SNV61785.1 Uncharacterised protein [Corynebacterium cystitidis]